MKHVHYIVIYSQYDPILKPTFAIYRYVLPPQLTNKTKLNEDANLITCNMNKW